MTDLRERFRDLDTLESPDLWSEAERRRPGTPHPEPPRRKLAAIAVAFVVAVAGVALVVRAFDGTPPRKPSTSLEPSVNGEIFFRGGPASSGPVYAVRSDGSGLHQAFPPTADHEQIAFSPDGTRIAWTSSVEGRYGIYVSAPDGSDPLRLTQGPNDAWPAWSPDGTQIAFSGSRPGYERCPHEGEWNLHCPTDLYVMAADGSQVRAIISDDETEYDPTWSPDGTRIAFTRGPWYSPAIYVANVDGSDVRKVSSVGGASDFAPNWMPTGDQIVFGSIRNENWGIFQVGADGTDERSVIYGGSLRVNDPVVSPDGTLIAFVGNSADFGSAEGEEASALYVMASDGTNVTKIAEVPGGVTEAIAWQPVSGSKESGADHASASSPPSLTGTLAYIEGRQGFGPIAVLDAASGESQHLTSQSFNSVTVAWSPDGSLIAMARSLGEGIGELVLVSASTGEIVRTLPIDPLMHPIDVTWAPDGTTLAFADTQADLWTIDVDGSNLRPHPIGALRAVHLEWSPDGDEIAFITDKRQLVLLALEGGEPSIIFSPDAGEAWFSPTWSPDGNRIAFSAIVDDVGQIFVIERDGSNLMQLTDDAEDSTDPTWSPGGAWIAFTRGGDHRDIYAVTPEGAFEQRMTETDKDEYGPDWG